MTKQIHTLFSARIVIRAALIAMFVLITAAQQPALAKCKACNCSMAAQINDHTDGQFDALERWMLRDFWGHPEDERPNVMRSHLMAMTKQLNTVGISLPQIFGTFEDAKLMLEAKDELNEMRYNSVQNNKPSTQLCEMASVSQGIIATRENRKQLQRTLVKGSQDNQLAKKGTPASGGPKLSADVRQAGICDYNAPTDNNNGASLTCPDGPAPDNMQGKSTNIARINESSTLEFDPAGDTLEGDTKAAQDFMNNVFGPEPLPVMSAEALNSPVQQLTYLDKRALAAKRSVAQYCFAHVLSQKAQGSSEGVDQMRAVLERKGIPPEVAESRISNNASESERLEMMTKDMFDSSFFVDVIGREADIKRKQAAVQQTSLLLRREMLASQTCNELMTSIIVELKVSDYQDAIQNASDGAR